MFSFINSFFSKSSKNLVAVVDLGSFLVKVIILDIKEKKIVSTGEALQSPFSMKGGNINDLKSIIKTINEAINVAENKIGESVSYVVFGISAEIENFYQRTFRGYIQTIGDEIGGSFLGYFYLPSVYPYSVKDKANYLIVDVGSNTTSITLVRDTFYKQSEAFPIAGDIFTKRISKIFSISKKEAEKVKALFCSGSSRHTFQLTQEDFGQDIDLWLNAFGISLKNLGEENLPRFIFLTGAGSLFPFIKDSLRSTDFPYEKLGFESVPEVNFLMDSGIKINKGNKIENIVTWIPARILAEFTLKYLVTAKMIKS